MNLYQTVILIFTVIVISEIFFSIIIRPYYVKKMFDENIETVTFPDVSVESFILLTIVFGLALGQVVSIPPFYFLGPIFMVYGFASLDSDFSFYLASALIFNIYRSLPFKEQMYKQKIFIRFLFFFCSFFFFITITLMNLKKS